MAINLDAFESYVKILVIGVGGGGSNAVNEMVDDELKSIDFWVFNTDAQALATSKSPNRFVLGEEVTKGLGAGGNPDVGKNAAESSSEKIKEIISGYDMVFIACGEGGGTGTGAAPVVAKIAKDLGALTVAIVTRPFTFEGASRLKKATAGISLLKENVDSLIIVSNDKLMFMNGKRALKDAFNESDKVLSQSVKTITDLILLPGVINLDFADVRNTLQAKGLAMIGFGMGKGDTKARDAATAAISSPLLEASIKGAKSAIVNITGGDGVTLNEAQEAVQYITEVAGGDVNIIFGVQTNPQFDDTMLVSVIATEFDEEMYNDNLSIITSRTGAPLNQNDLPEVESVNENSTQGKNSVSDFSEEDDILPSFFAKVKKSKPLSSDFEESNEAVKEEKIEKKSKNVELEESHFEEFDSDLEEENTDDVKSFGDTKELSA
jgi:cell division protein FtsZ